MSQKRSTLLIWVAVIFILSIACLITDRNNLAEKKRFIPHRRKCSPPYRIPLYITPREGNGRHGASMAIPQYKPMKTAQYFLIPLRNGIRSAVR